MAQTQEQIERRRAAANDAVTKAYGILTRLVVHGESTATDRNTIGCLNEYITRAAEVNNG